MPLISPQLPRNAHLQPVNELTVFVRFMLPKKARGPVRAQLVLLRLFCKEQNLPVRCRPAQTVPKAAGEVGHLVSLVLRLSEAVLQVHDDLLLVENLALMVGKPLTHQPEKVRQLHAP